MSPKSIKYIFILVCILLLQPLYSQNIDFFVSPNGNDTSGNGSLESPFKTIGRMKSILRTHPQKDKSNFTVYLRDGVYPVSETIIFDENDGGTDTFQIKYVSCQNEKPVISGMIKVTDWSQVPGKPYYKATVSSVGFRQLYVNGFRKARAKTNYPITGLYWTSIDKGGIIIKTDELLNLTNVTDAEFHIQSEWRDAYIPIDSISLKASGWYVYSSNMKQVTSLNPISATPTFDKPFNIENALELLDQPGEWYCDNKNNFLYYYPEIDEDINLPDVIIPATERLITIKGSAKNTPVKNLVFDGITFKHAGWSGPNKKGWYGYQAGLLVQPSGYSQTYSAVYVEYARKIAFQHCEFFKTGAVGLDLHNGISDCSVECCLFYDIGDAGLSVSTFNHDEIDQADEDSCNYILIQNNLFYRTGQDFYGAPAVVAYYVKGFKFVHNEIFDVPYSGLSLGWGWNGKPDSKTCRDNIISNNRIGNYLKICRDGGGTYTLGQQPNSICSNNYYYNQKNEYGAIYFDAGTSGYTANNNVVQNSPRWLNIGDPTIKNITLDNNYTTTSTLTNNGTNIVLTNTHVVPGANWNSEAKAIISNAGINACTSLRSILQDTAGNKPPVINIASSFSFSLIENGILEASVTDQTNPYNMLNIAWNQEDGPGTITFSSLSSLRTKVAFSHPGLYHVFLIADDGLLKSSKKITINVSDFNIGVNQALNKQTFASSVYDSISYLAANAVDGNINTIWHPKYLDFGTSWWSVDLLDSLFIDRIEMVTRQAFPQAQTRCNFAVLASDSVNFAVYDILGGQGPDTIPFKGTWTLNTGEQSKKYRYLKVVKTADYNHTIAEFRVFSFDTSNFVDSPLSEMKLLKIYPNPANNYINIELPGEMNCFLSIINLNGNVLFYQKYNQLQRIEVNIYDWPTGIYYVNCLGEEKKYQNKFIIIR